MKTTTPSMSVCFTVELLVMTTVTPHLTQSPHPYIPLCAPRLVMTSGSSSVSILNEESAHETRGRVRTGFVEVIALTLGAGINVVPRLGALDTRRDWTYTSNNGNDHQQQDTTLRASPRLQESTAFDGSTKPTGCVSVCATVRRALWLPVIWQCVTSSCGRSRQRPRILKVQLIALKRQIIYCHNISLIIVNLGLPLKSAKLHRLVGNFIWGSGRGRAWPGQFEGWNIKLNLTFLTVIFVDNRWQYCARVIDNLLKEKKKK